MDTQLQSEIIAALEVIDPETFDAAAQAERRIEFLTRYLQETGARGLVLGISGGVDSTVAGRLCQLACERVREAGGDAQFVAVRLPYRVQKDEEDAAAAVEFIAPDVLETIDIGPATDGMWDQVLASRTPVTDAKDDYHKGNVKARMRMTAQYAIAGARGMLVVGTDQAAEAVVGFYTKFGDGAADVTPMFGLPKRRVREIGVHLGTPESLVNKVPTADLESDKPLLPDEEALGVRYDVVDDYLEGKEVAEQDEATIVGWYRRTAHKRALPVTPDGYLGRP
ncbi:ammonia-dependent NAD(+) synthetase [Georgenia sp. 311]|uniref:NH(3)-dependent NAD(+) synthetase n=1 Tax=Georgenia wutianyii TaxID=2585135 RepID=A0ABX5VJI2_9MICO|nr:MULTISPECIES: ammonia-dependent NAD(+) synthetase [Georgenia]QDB78582.1 ammonia-dependent NAD(+) synthetase [Georgenia wutianyii]TNC17628.1 ammonia-dependent NAD(+) synthetase [Georgenia sp. 311]